MDHYASTVYLEEHYMIKRFFLLRTLYRVTPQLNRTRIFLTEIH